MYHRDVAQISEELSMMVSPKRHHVQRVYEVSDAGCSEAGGYAPSAALSATATARELQERDAQLASLTDQLCEKNKELASMSAQISALQVKATDASDNRLQAEITKVKSDIAALREELAAHSKQLVERKAAEGELELEVVAVKAARDRAMATEINEVSVVSRTTSTWHECEVDANEEFLKVLSGMLAEKKADFVNKITQISELKSEILAKDGEVSNMSAQLKQMWWKLQMVAKESAASERLAKEADRLRREISAQNAKLSEMTSEIAELQQVAKETQGLLRVENGKAITDTSAVEPDWRAYEDMLAAHASKNFELFYEKQDIELKRHVLQEVKRSVETDWATWKETPESEPVEDSEGRRAEVHKATELLTGGITELAKVKAELFGKKIEIERLNGALGTRMLLVNTKKEEVDHLKSEIQQVEADSPNTLDVDANSQLMIHQYEAQEREIQQRLAREYKQRIDAVEGELARRKSEEARVEQRLQEAKARFEEEQRRRKAELDHTSGKHEVLLDKVKKLQEEVAEQDAILDAERSRLASLEATRMHQLSDVVAARESSHHESASRKTYLSTGV
jgi:chromosome segregation ATPase